MRLVSDKQADLGLCSLHMSEDTFSHGIICFNENYEKYECSLVEKSVCRTGVRGIVKEEYLVIIMG